MSFMEKLAKALGLKEDATEADIIKAIGALKSDNDAAALQSQLTDIGTVLGVAEGGDVIAAAKLAVEAEGTGGLVEALQSQVTELSTSLTSLTQSTTLKAAETFVDGEIERGRVGVKPMRDHYIAMHQQDAARVEKEIGALPVLNGTFIRDLPPASEGGEISLNAEQKQAAALIGVTEEDYLKQLKSEQEGAAA